MAAGLVDRVQVTLFLVITGQTGVDPIFQGAADFDLELIEAGRSAATSKSSSTGPPCISESNPAPHPSSSRSPTRKFPLTDMPTGPMAALVTRLADHLLIRRVVRRAGRSRTSLRSCAQAERIYTLESASPAARLRGALTAPRRHPSRRRGRRSGRGGRRSGGPSDDLAGRAPGKSPHPPPRRGPDPPLAVSSAPAIRRRRWARLGCGPIRRTGAADPRRGRPGERAVEPFRHRHSARPRGPPASASSATARRRRSSAQRRTAPRRRRRIRRTRRRGWTRGVRGNAGRGAGQRPGLRRSGRRRSRRSSCRAST